MAKKTLLKANNICKNFGPTVALNNVSIEVYCGEIRGLIGENGSGKSTLSSIISGIQKPTSGTMEYKGKIWSPSTMIEALDSGIGMIVQESGTIQGITVAENMFLGETTKFAKFGPFISRKAMNQAADEALHKIGVTNIKGNMRIDMLDLQDRKLVEIAKVINKNPELFILDETTTALSQAGRKIIYEIINDLKKRNKGILFISHDLNELMEVCDTITVLRDGAFVRNLAKEEFDVETIKQLLVGREMTGDYYRSDFIDSCSDEIVLEVKNVSKGDQLNNINLNLHKGEILGVGGLSDCGMHTLGKCVFGAEHVDKGEILVHGAKIKNPEQAMRNNVGYVPKDRDVESLNLNASIIDNISIAGLDIIKNKKLFLVKKSEKNYVQKQVEQLQVKCSNVKQLVSDLSGGNKQKVVFGKWIGRNSDVLILDCPTRGVDIGVKQSMYQLIYKLKKEGKSFIIISEELSELIGMSDRVLIMKDGKISGEFKRNPSLNESALIRYMI